MKAALLCSVILCALAAIGADPPANSIRKVFLPARLHTGNTGITPQQPIDDAAWIWHPDLAQNVKDREPFFSGGWSGPEFLRFTREFDGADTPLVFHVSADERFELFLDGHRIARGPDRADVQHWSYASYEAQLAPGRHRFEALVWRVGPLAPMAQLTFRGGFIFKAEGAYDARLTTGKAAWEVQKLEGLSFTTPGDGIFGVGGQMTVRGCGPQWKTGPSAKAMVVRGPLRASTFGEAQPGWALYPTILPDQIDREVLAGRAVALGRGVPGRNDPISAEHAKDAGLPRWQALVDGKGEVTIPPQTELFLLWDLGDYYCAQPYCEISGADGARITWAWAEALYQPRTNVKGNRDEFVGKTFHGLSDTFLPDGTPHAKFSTHWWRAGRYCLLSVKTADQPLTVHRLSLIEDRYPLENEGAFDSGDADLQSVITLASRGLQMCSHETFMDCPFYEQLMYDGDSRLEMLTTYALTPDDRLVRHGLELFDYSRHQAGFVNERYPSMVPQYSTTFSLIWALMLHDYAWWRNDLPFVRARVLGLRAMLEQFEPYRNAEGLLDQLPGWSFMDWVPQWRNGCAPDSQTGVSALNNLLYIYALEKSAEIEDGLNEPLLATRLRAQAARTAEAVRTRFWDEGRGLMADDLAHKEFSEHGQCLALLTDTLTGPQASRAFNGLLLAPDLKRTTIYFSFYLLETWRKFSRGDLIIDRLGFWKDLVKQGLKTPVEQPGNSRSDCHAWGSHPLFHLHASVAGVRPASLGFRSVRIEPLPGNWPKIISRTPHPDGFVELNLTFDPQACHGTVFLPGSLTGTLVWKGKETPLSAGTNNVNVQP